MRQPADSGLVDAGVGGTLPVEPASVQAGPANARQRAAGVRLLAMDVDGTLTDGSLLIGQDAEIAKAFSVRDGFGLTLLAKAGMELALVTGRESPIVVRRAAELGITRVHQRVKDKLAMLQVLCHESGIGLEQAAFVGDDWPDLPPMMACGLAAAPADAVEEVRRVAHWVSAARGGQGAVRELAMFILDSQGRRADLLAPYLA
jgi:3-deoxy-D-manno-octulosonate 8-phosphate phosphatase (KDO 8-P phosphatase)